MSFGKMTTVINIVRVEPVKDAEGFATTEDRVIASVRAYREDRHGSEAWRNRAVFYTADTMFRFRVIPGLTVTPSMVILCPDGRFNIISVEDVKRRGAYVEVLAEKTEPSKNG